jgi:serine/threonine-protein kinase
MQRALALEPRNAEALRNLADAYDAAKRIADAESTYRRAIELRQNSWAAYKELAVFLYRQGRLAEAVPYFQHVVALIPDSYLAYSNLGGVLLRLGRHDEAAASLRKSLAIRPTWEAYSNLGTIEYLLERYADASELYAKAVELNSSSDRLWGNLADSYRWTPGREQNAKAAYRRALGLAGQQVAVDPQNGLLRSERAQYWAALGMDSQARQEIAQAVRLAPRDGLVLFHAALVDEQGGRREDALRNVRAALEAGFPREEISKAPPLRALRQDPQYARLIANIRSNPISE